MSILKAVPAAVLLAALSTPAMAQVVGVAGDVEGSVVLERQSELFVVQSMSALQAGDSVFAYDDSFATITLHNGCELNLAENEAVRIVEAASCETSFETVSDAEFVSMDQLSGLSGAQIIFGLGAIVGAGFVIEDLISDDDDSPASP